MAPRHGPSLFIPRLFQPSFSVLMASQHNFLHITPLPFFLFMLLILLPALVIPPSPPFVFPSSILHFSTSSFLLDLSDSYPLPSSCCSLAFPSLILITFYLFYFSHSKHILISQLQLYLDEHYYLQNIH